MPNPRKPRTFIPSKYTRYTVVESLPFRTECDSWLALVLPAQHGTVKIHTSTRYIFLALEVISARVTMHAMPTLSGRKSYPFLLPQLLL